MFFGGSRLDLIRSNLKMALFIFLSLVLCNTCSCTPVSWSLNTLLLSGKNPNLAPGSPTPFSSALLDRLDYRMKRITTLFISQADEPSFSSHVPHLTAPKNCVSKKSLGTGSGWHLIVVNIHIIYLTFIRAMTRK